MPKLNTPQSRSARAALAATFVLFLALVATLVLLCTLALAPAARAQTMAPATITGRVTDGERGATGVTIILVYNEPTRRFRLAARVKTDADGRFLLTNVAPGLYQILPIAPAHVVAGLGVNYPPGRPLNIVAGEEVKDIDFRIEPGGVITGRITDADGNPVVAEQVMAAPAEQSMGPPRFNFDQRDMLTDDRGVYRLFGLPPGSYRVSVGRADDSGAVSYGRRKLFRRTFYPDATESAQARIVEVKSGIEATDIDIMVGRPLKTYKVSGRFVTADTNQPVANIPVSYSTMDARGRRMGGFSGFSMTNARGEFVSDGLAPGRYVVYSTNSFDPQQEQSEFYSDGVPFEVTDGDVSGLLVKLKRGATVSGVVTIEGLSDRAAAAQMLSGVRVSGWVESFRQQVGPSGQSRPVTANPDGTFRLTGLTPGKLRLGTFNDAVKGLTTTRIELNNANVLAGFDLAEGAQVTGVRIVMTYGTATLVGQTTFINGPPAAGARLMAFARLVGPAPGATVSRSAEVDARGFFRLEGMPAGEYEVIVRAFPLASVGGTRIHMSEPLRIVLGDGGEAKVTPVLDFK